MAGREEGAGGDRTDIPGVKAAAVPTPSSTAVHTSGRVLARLQLPINSVRAYYAIQILIMSFAARGQHGGRGHAAGSTTRSTVQYGTAAPPRALGGGAPTFGSAHSTKGTFVAPPQSKQVRVM